MCGFTDRLRARSGDLIHLMCGWAPAADGSRVEPRGGYDDLQSPTGTWTERVRDVGYRACLARSPAEHPQSWVALHGKESLFRRNLVTFACRWLDDQDASVRDILNFKLYPWHSHAVNAPVRPPPDLIERFVGARGKVLFDKICRRNAITHRLTWPSSAVYALHRARPRPPGSAPTPPSC